MQFPKPKSPAGALLYGVSIIALGLVARVAWVVVGQNVEVVSQEKGYDKLLSRHWSEIVAWFAVNGFWLALLTAFFLGAACALWANAVLAGFASSRRRLTVDENEPAPLVAATVTGPPPVAVALMARREAIQFNLDVLKRELTAAEGGFAMWMELTEPFRRNELLGGAPPYAPVSSFMNGVTAKFEKPAPLLPDFDQIYPKIETDNNPHESPPRRGIFDPAKNGAFLYALEKYIAAFKNWVDLTKTFIVEREQEIQGISREIRESAPVN